MNTKDIRWGRIILAGLLATLIGFVIGFILYGALNGVYENYSDLPYAKQPTSIPSYLLQMIVGSLVITILFAIIYAIIEDGLPGQNLWQKGLSFGLLLLAVNMLPIAFNTWMQINQPDVLILIEAMNRSISLMIQALIISLVYNKGK